MLYASSRTHIVVALLLCLCAARGVAQPSQAQTTDQLIAAAQKALYDKQYQAAERDFSRLLQLGVHTAPVYSNLGVTYLHLGKPEQAIRMLDKAKTLAPDVAGIRLNLGLAYVKLRDFKLASTSFAEVIAMDPSHTQAHYLKGMCDFMRDDFQGAVAAFEAIRHQQKNDLEFLFMLGISYGMLKRNAESQQTFTQLVQSGGDTPHLHLLLGKAYLALGQLDEAATELQQAAQGTTLPYAHYYLGVLASKQGKMDEASQQFSQEVALVPINPWAYKELAAIEMDRNENAKAIALLQNGVRENPESAELSATLGRALMNANQVEQAIPLFQKSVKMDPQNGTYHYQLARAYLAQGRKSEAEVEMARSRQLVNDDSQGKMQQFSREQINGAPPPE